MSFYSNPEIFGLKILKEFNAGESYEFDMLVLFLDLKTNRVLIGKDSG